MSNLGNRTIFCTALLLFGLPIVRADSAAAPTFNPVGGTYLTSHVVAINTATNGASINYTTDGSSPSDTVGTLYTGPFTISATTMIRAIAFASGLDNSAVSSVTYTIQSAAASITSVSPTTGQAGTTVTVVGTGFGTVQGMGAVWLGSAQGLVVSWSDTQIVATVASNSTSGTAQVRQLGA